MLSSYRLQDRLNDLVTTYLNRGYTGIVLNDTCLLVFDSDTLKDLLHTDLGSLG